MKAGSKSISGAFSRFGAWTFRRMRSRESWLALDSWIDSSLYHVWLSFRDFWSGYSSFFHRFQTTGVKRLLAELASEGVTWGIAGLTVTLAFALPAFQLTRGGWHNVQDYSVTFLDRYGNEIGKRGVLHSAAVPLDEIPPVLIQATLATEDRRFYDHFGIDVLGTMRALVQNVRAKEVVQGGSSITQQLAKNLFLSSERSLERKVNELFLAFWLESHYTKNQILKLYLDRAYMGGGAFGVEAASQFYFDKSVRDITLAEAAVLAGLYKAPTKYAPHVHPQASRKRTNEVLDNMVEAGFLTEGQVHGARLNPAQVVDRGDHYSPDWFLDWAFDRVQKLMQGKDDYELTVRTTVDVRLQKAAERAVESTLDTGHGRAHQAALVSMDRDGAVRALVGGKDYGDSQYNRATDAHRQPGSSFKPYVYITALENGYTPRSTVVDGPVYCGHWSPKNYENGYRGRMTLTSALAHSVNTVAVKLSLAVDRSKVLKTAHDLGLKEVKKTCSMALGDTGVTVLEHTGAYASFANGGMNVTPYGIEEIRNVRGELVYLRERDAPKPKRVFPEKKVEQLNYMLGQVVLRGTGRRAQLDFTTAAGKTGTSSNYRDAWFMGFTGQYVTGVWFGNDNYHPTGRVTGGNLPAMAWHDYNVAAHTSPDIPKIPGLPIHPNQAAEMARLAEMRKNDPSFGAGSADQKISAKTLTILKHLSGMLKEAPALDADGVVNPQRKAETPHAGTSLAASNAPPGR